MKEWNAKHIHDTLLEQSESAELQEKPFAAVQCAQNKKGLVHPTGVKTFHTKGFFISQEAAILEEDADSSQRIRSC